MKQCLVIDFDGTIVDPAPRDYALYCHIMGRFGYQSLPFKEYWPLRRESTKLDLLLSKTGMNSYVSEYTCLRCILCENDEFIVHDRLFPGVEQALIDLDEHYGLILVSARFKRDTLFKQVKQLGIMTWFEDIIVTGGDKFDVIKRIENVEAVIGDTEHDIKPAKALGIKSIGLTTGIRSRQFLIEAGADIILDSFVEVPHTLGLVRAQNIGSILS